MTETKRILYLEDDPLDFELVQAALGAAGAKYVLTRVETQEEFLAAIRAGGWQVICSDHTLHGFNGDWALSQARAHRPEVPFIFISGRMGEETAIDSLKRGATDYVLKHALVRLVPAVERALREAAERAELRRAEDALKASAALYRLLMDSSPDVVLLLDREERCRYLNSPAAQLLQRKAEDLLGRRQTELFPSEVAQRHSQAIQEVFRTGQPSQSEELIGLPHGRMWADTRLLPVRNAQSEVIQVVAILRDITERKRAEEDRQHWDARLQQLQKLESLGAMAGGVAHDFNNILTSILGYTDLLADEVPAGSVGHDYLRQLTAGARRAAELTMQLLAYSGRGRFVIRSLSLSQLVREMSHLLDISGGRRNLLKYRLLEKLPVIEGDANQMRQAILNLVTNAAEAVGDRDGQVTISTGLQECDQASLAGTYLQDNLSPGTHVFLEVEDTGSGMTAETLAHAFEPFFTTKSTGRGLGLAAVLGIVRGLGGGIKAASEPARGSRFRLLFPVARTFPPPAVAAARQAAEQWRGGGTALLVETEAASRKTARGLLEELGFDVLAVSSGFEATEVFRARAAEIRLLVLSAALSRLDLEHLFLEVSQVRNPPRVIVAAPEAEFDSMKRLHQPRVAGFVHKPFEAAELREVLREAHESAASPAPAPPAA